MKRRESTIDLFLRLTGQQRFIRELDEAARELGRIDRKGIKSMRAFSEASKRLRSHG